MEVDQQGSEQINSSLSKAAEESMELSSKTAGGSDITDANQDVTPMEIQTNELESHSSNSNNTIKSDNSILNKGDTKINEQSKITSQASETKAKESEKSLQDVSQEISSNSNANGSDATGSVATTTTESLGRNRRVRQKNRYLLDFHCIDLTKGGRWNRDDYDAAIFQTTSSSASSSSRSNRNGGSHSQSKSTPTNNSSSSNNNNNNQSDLVEGIELKYCRRCSSRTAHDVGGGCQTCLYKRIVEQQHDTNTPTNKLEKNDLDQSESVKPEPNNTKIDCNEIDNEIENENGSDNSALKAEAQVSPVGDLEEKEQEEISNEPQKEEHGQLTKQVQEGETNSDTIKVEEFGPKIDTWTPDDVADFIIEKGFAGEAELFKTESVDGMSLLLMQRTDFTYGLKIKLGPALKIYDQVCKLKKEYFRNLPVNHSIN